MFEEPELQPSSLKEILNAQLYSVDFNESPAVRNNLSRILKHIKIIVDIIFYTKYQLNK
jgi:hypothetical protein